MGEKVDNSMKSYFDKVESALDSMGDEEFEKLLIKSGINEYEANEYKMIRRRIKDMVDFENELLELRMLTNRTREDAKEIITEIGEDNMGYLNSLIKQGYSTEYAITVIKECEKNEIPFEVLEVVLRNFKKQEE
ncbi:hypothetical protein [Clostridium sp. UBA2485]|uniref:hypothetical protein n=2 Tax=unclassified Clostridium TaxID=2614128 RepID=UPI0025C05C16|nr:hypothetical protein [Clostridium sp. UBA2485]